MINTYFQTKKKMMTLKLSEATGYPCVLYKSAGKNLKDYKIYGNSEQEKNLFVNYTFLNCYFTDATGTLSGGGNPGTIGYYIPCEPNTTYVVQKTLGSRFRVCYTTNIPSSGVAYYGGITRDTGKEITITTDSNANYLFMFLDWASSGIPKEDFEKDVIVKDTIVSPENPIEVVSLGETSKNLINPYNIVLDQNVTMEIVGNDIVFTHNGLSTTTRELSYDITLPAGTYTINKTDDTIITVGTNGSGKARLTVPKTYNLTNSSTTINFKWFIGSGTTKILSNFQIEESPIATEYKPFYCIYVKSIGKNLLDSSLATQRSPYYGVDIKNKYDKDITLSISLKEGKTIPSGVSFGLIYKSTEQSSSVADWIIQQGVLKREKSSTYWENASHIDQYNHYYSFIIGCYPGNKVTWDLINDTFDIQLEYGNNVSTEYEPYQTPITTTINLEGHEPLRKIGNVSDYIDYKNKKIIRNIGVTTFKGTERWSLPTGIVDGYSAYRFLSFFPKAPTDNFSCSHFVVYPKSNYTSSPITNKATSYLQTNQLIILVENSVANSNLQTSMTEWKNWLAEQYANGTPVTIYYELATPIEEPFESLTIPTIKKTCIITANDEEIEASNMYAKYTSK